MKGLGIFGDNAKTAAIVDATQRLWQHDEIRSAIARVRSALLQHGVARGQNVAVIAPNCPDFLFVYFAVTALGANVVPVNWHLTADELRHILSISQATVVFVHEQLHARVSAVIQGTGGISPKIIKIGVGAQDGQFGGEFGDSSETMLPVPEVLGRTTLFTSATTGKPKAIALPPSNGFQALVRSMAFRESFGITSGSEETHLCASMLYHSAPLDGVLIALHMGNKAVLLERWDPLVALQAIQQHRVTSVLLTPTMMVQLARIPRHERATFDTSSLRMVIHTGAPCAVEIKREMIDWLGPVVYEGYGATEGTGTFVSSQDWLRYPGTVGKAIPGATIKILDDAGNELPPGVEGLIYIKAYTGDRFEYLNEPEKTAACFRGELYTPGDIGYLNDAGYLFVRDRKTDLILCGGANIYPAEIEGQLILHPKVRDCAVIGLPHETLGEVVHAVIEPAHYTAAVDRSVTSELIRFLVPRLAASKLPHSFEYVEQLPRDPNGKLLKRRLKEKNTVRSTSAAALTATS